MMCAEEINKVIWDLADHLHGLIFSPDRLSGATVRLLFLKYAVDNSLGATDLASMQLCAKAQKMFALRDTENGLETTIPFLRNIDRAYMLDNIIGSEEIIEQYAGELFGMDRSRQKKNVSGQQFKRIMDWLGSLDLEEENGNHETGRMLVDALRPMISVSMNRLGKAGAENMSPRSLGSLAAAILNISRQDRYCDFLCGNGLSTIEITGEKMPEVSLADVNREAAATMAMLLILYGYPHFTIRCGDSLNDRISGIGGNKIFIDPPLGMRMKKSERVRFSDITLAAIDSLIHGYLLPDGTAVVAVPSGPLFRQGPDASLKQEIISLGLLHAVIALPPLWSGTNVGTNLLVIEKNPSFNILFVDATDSTQLSRDKRRAQPSGVLSGEIVEKIADVVHNPHDIAGFANVISGEMVIEKELNLVPANYVMKQRKEEMTLAEIDEQLAELYRQLNL